MAGLDDSFLFQDEEQTADRLDDSFLFQDEEPGLDLGLAKANPMPEATAPEQIPTTAGSYTAEPGGTLNQDPNTLVDTFRREEQQRQKSPSLKSRVAQGIIGALAPAINKRAADIGVEDYDAEKVASEVFNPENLRRPHLRPKGEVGEKGLVEGLKETWDQPERLIPFGGQANEMAELKDLYDAAKRIENGKGTDRDQELVQGWMERGKEDANRGSTLGYKVVNLLSHLPAFVGEFAMTGGAYSAGKNVASKGIQKLIKETTEKAAEKGLLRQGTEASIGAVLQTPLAMGMRIRGNTYERMLDGYNFSKDEQGKLKAVMSENADDFNTALTKAVGDSYIEILSERSGGAIPLVWAKLPGAAKIDALKAATVSKWFKKYPNKRVDDLLKVIREKGGWHGVFGEIMEERIGEAARYATGVEDEYTPYEQYKKGELGQSLLSEAIAFSVPGAGASAMRRMTSKKPDQADQPPEMFKPTHRTITGEDVQIVTQAGQVVPGTYIDVNGNVIRDDNATATTPNGDDVSLDVNATIGAVKAEVEAKRGGIVGDQMGPIQPIGTPETGRMPLSDNLAAAEQVPGKADEITTDIAGELNKLVDETETAGAPAITPADEVTLEANKAATSPKNDLPEPTDAQKENGNYKKGHTKVQGLDIAIENPAGSKRRPEWPTLKQHYGYIKRTVGADSEPGAAPHQVEQIDAFVKPDTDIAADNPIFIIDQTHEDGSWDEHKVMMGFESEQEARDAYMANYTKGWKGLKNITQVTQAELKDWVNNGDTTKPYAKAEVEQNVKRGTKVEALGKESSVKTSKGSQIKTKFTVVEADTLVASNNDAGNKNPNYPAELQPRDRSRGASQLQIKKIANNLDPTLLEDSAKASDGAPIIGSDSVVESGNARVLGIRGAYSAKKAEAYRQHLIKNAAAYGLTEDQIENIKAPVLVRVRQDEMDTKSRAEFARQANQPDIAPMSPMEQAQSDSDRITDEDMKLYAPSDNGNILASSNQSFLQNFAGRLGDLEAGGLSTSDGRWTKQMGDRVQAAIFNKAYGDERLLNLVAEEADPDIKNILNALNKAAPAFARARAIKADLGQLDIVSDIVSAIDVIRKAKAKGTSVAQEVSQTGLFGNVDPVVATLAEFIESGTRSSRRLGIGFTEMATFLESELLSENQEALFDKGEVGKAEIVSAANKRITEVYGNENGITDLFSQSQTEQRGDERHDQPGTRRGKPEKDTGTEAKTPTEKKLKPKAEPKRLVPKHAATLRKLADGLEKQIDEKLNPATADQNLTPRRARIIASMRADGERLQEAQAVMRGIAAGLEDGTVDSSLTNVRNKKTVQELVRLTDHTWDQLLDETQEVLKRAKITKKNFKKATRAVQALIKPPSEEQLKKAKLTELQSSLLGTKIPGFFSTPPAVARKVVEMADIQPGMTVLEPSAGSGGIADMVKEAHPGAELSVNEINSKLNEVLKAKGYEPTQGDFLEMTGKYDRIVMNPPFEKGQDIAHLEHAYSMLKPGGVVVSITGESPFFRSEKKYQDFRDWVDNLGGEVEELQPGDLSDPKAPQRSNVKGRIVTLVKPDTLETPDLAARAEPSQDPYAAMNGKEVSYQVEVEDTGETYTVTVDAGVAMQELDARAEALEKLKGCL